jgi:hypothetical protein
MGKKQIPSQLSVRRSRKGMCSFRFSLLPVNCACAATATRRKQIVGS